MKVKTLLLDAVLEQNIYDGFKVTVRLLLRIVRRRRSAPIRTWSATPV